MLSARDPVRRRQPVERPLDIVALELLVSISQALLAGILLALATQLGGDARAYGLPVPGLLAILGFAVGVGWARWLMGGSGWVMASVCLAISMLAGALWLLSLQDATLPRIDPLVGLVAVACAVYGLVAGVFLDGPHRAHWKGGVSQPRRGMPQTRATPARFSPPVQKVVDERLTDIHLPKVSLPSVPKVSMPSVTRPGRSDEATPAQSGSVGLAVAAPVAPQSPTAAEPATTAEADAPTPPTEATQAAEVVPTPATDRIVAAEEAAPEAPDAPTEATFAEVPTEANAVPEAGRASDGPAEAPEDAGTALEASPEPDADPEAPTEPVARPAPAWPRPIEPRGHTGAHTTDPSP
jgi:hypothetical protein